MTLKEAQARAQRLSQYQRIPVVVVKSAATELLQPYYTESYSSAIPKEQMVCLYAHGMIVSHTPHPMLLEEVAQ